MLSCPSSVTAYKVLADATKALVSRMGPLCFQLSYASGSHAMESTWGRERMCVAGRVWRPEGVYLCSQVRNRVTAYAVLAYYSRDVGMDLRWATTCRHARAVIVRAPCLWNRLRFMGR